MHCKLYNMICPLCRLEQEPEVRIPDLLLPQYPLCPGCGRRHPIRDLDQWVLDRSLAMMRANLVRTLLMNMPRRRMSRLRIGKRYLHQI